MRLWSIHPEYLDRQGLLGAWRESLLAQKVLLGRTRGYKKHPQLERFRRQAKPLEAIGFYLYGIYKEGIKRGYSFKKEKISKINLKVKPVKVTHGQIAFEIEHLIKKLKRRDKKRLKMLSEVKKFKLHPLFIAARGGREPWEKQEDK